MPEMPEVETICRSLKNYLTNRRIDKVDILLPRQIKYPTAEEFAVGVAGKTITAVKRRAKYILLELSDGANLVIHLRMTGRLVYHDENVKAAKHDRLLFRLDNGATLVYADTRTLGAIYLLQPGEENRVGGLVTLGPEPLSDEFTTEKLKKICCGKRAKIKSALLNQSFIAGLGNIYADEALFLARIHPERLAASLGDDEIAELHRAVNKVIADGIKDGGTTFRDYQNAEGGHGSHQDHLYVYQRTGNPCLRCGSPIQRLVIGGRSSHFCPKCQK